MHLGISSLQPKRERPCKGKRFPCMASLIALRRSAHRHLIALTDE